MYMEMPSTMNMLSCRITPATLVKLAHLSGTLYCQVSCTGESVKLKGGCGAAEFRPPQVKGLASGKPESEKFPTKWEAGTTDDLTLKTPVKMSKGLTGKELMAFSVFVAVGVPLTVKRFFAHSIGLSENSKLFRRPYVTFIPSRITKSYKTRMKYSAESWTTFRRDEYMKLMKKYGSRYGIR
jgi:hypothetical protein